MAWSKLTKSIADAGFLEGTGFLAGEGLLTVEFAWTKLDKQTDSIEGYGADYYGIDPYGSPPAGSMWTKLTKATQ